MIGKDQLLAADETVGNPDRRSVSRSAIARVPDKLHILIVEDEFFVAWDLQAKLMDLNFGFCEIASDVQSAIDRAINLEADLLLMDINLGEGGDGIQVIQRVREYRDARVIFITAYTDETNLNRIRQIAPRAPVLAKPVSLEILRTAISQVFPDRKI